MSRQKKRIILMLVDIFLIVIAFSISYFFLIFYIDIPILYYFAIYSVVTISYLLVGTYLKVFSRLNRYTNTKEIFSIFVSLTIVHLIAFSPTFFSNALISRRVLALTYLFAILLIPASRLGWRFLVEYYLKRERAVKKKKRTLVVGAGAGSDILFKRLELESGAYRVVGVVDDDRNKLDTYLYNVPVLGTLSDISRLARRMDIEHVIVAIPSLRPEKFEQILDICNRFEITVNSMPTISEVLSDNFSTKHLREVDVVDLLGRDEVKLDMKGLSDALTGKTILVTGAGGSIGSEICRQVGQFKPKKLILLGQGENSIYQIHRELKGRLDNQTEIIPVIANIQDRDKIFEVMKKFFPHIVYHAAAHKHVPLMEANPIEAVKNNIYGTKNVAEAAKHVGVDNFVMVSTDKAVNPPNVMGATKRVAEMIVTGLNETGCTKFCAVRFGNVLGSRGSVVPLFKEQIAKGGPVTVTDFRMTRYFMTIPEASRLVIQAGSLAGGGEIFILDMGQPVKIHDLAKKVIKLSGYTEKQIPIVETGIRPGEKLYEELLITSEQTGKSVYEKIFVGKVTQLPLEEVMDFVESLEDNETLKDQLIHFANTSHLAEDIDVVIENQMVKEKKTETHQENYKVRKLLN